MSSSNVEDRRPQLTSFFIKDILARGSYQQLKSSQAPSIVNRPRSENLESIYPDSEETVRDTKLNRVNHSLQAPCFGLKSREHSEEQKTKGQEKETKERSVSEDKSCTGKSNLLLHFKL